MDDDELLREYARNRSQEAFRSLVDRHLGMVYGAARRMVGDDQLAEEIAQGAFSTLAQKAASIRPPQIVGGWLYNTTRHLAMHAIRTEQRRRKREQTAVAMQALDAMPEDRRILEQLEPAMAELEADDRDTLVLRFLENRSLREVGEELGISEDAARMRVNRALERLRTVFGRQGVTVTAVVLGAAITAGTAVSVPAGLAAAITATALAGTAATAVALTHTTLTAMNLLNLKTAAVVIAAAVMAGAGTYYSQQPQIVRLRADNQNLAAQSEKIRSDQATADAALQAQKQELARLHQESDELLRLRSEVTQLRQQHETDAKLLAQKAAQAQAVKSPAPASIVAGAYVTKAQLADMGYATPEAAFETMTWAMMTGDYNRSLASLKPELEAQELGNTNGPKSFSENRREVEPYFKGIQVLAKKVLTDDKVELKIKMDADPMPNRPSNMPDMIQPMVKVGNEWKLGGSTRQYTASWEQDGLVQPAGQ